MDPVSKKQTKGKKLGQNEVRDVNKGTPLQSQQYAAQEEVGSHSVLAYNHL